MESRGNILNPHLRGNRSGRGSSRTTVGSSTAISTKYGGDPKTISKLIILTKYGGEPDTSEKSTRKTILKMILTQKYSNPRRFCILLVKIRWEAQIFTIYKHLYGTSFI